MAGDSEKMGQDEIEELLRQAQGGDAAAETPATGDNSPPPAESARVDQSEIEALLSGGAAAPAAAASAPPPQAAAGGSTVTQNDIELLLNKAEQALDSIDQADAAAELPEGIRSFEFKPFSGTAANKETATLELMSDVQLDMTIELGRTHMELEDVLKLKQGSVVPLDKLAGDPADIYVNGRLVARGEVLVLNDNFCIRVAELVVGESACA